VYEEVDFSRTLPDLQRLGFSVQAAMLDGEPLSGLQMPQKTLLLLGSEAHGVAPELLPLANRSISIERYGKAESLNVGIACGVILAHWRQQKSPK
jgi:tRNA G18 (ribose-2'-O)-methylase SpoU